MVAAGELNAAVGEEGVERYIAMTCQTDDPEREAAYLAFVRDIEPKLKPIQNAIRSRYLDSPVPIGAAPRPLLRLRPRPGESPQPVSRGEHPPRDPAGRAGAAVSEDHRCHDRHLSRPGAHPGPDGPVSGRDRPRRPPRSLGARRQPAARGSRDARRAFRPDETAPDRDRAARRASPISWNTRSAIASGSITASPTRSGFTRRSNASWFRLTRQIQEKHRAALGVETLRPWDLAVDPLGRPPL